MVGHKFDACLDESSYGSRLRRVRGEEELDIDAIKPFHLKATGSFEPYFHPYKKWRKDGLEAIRTELTNKQSVIAVSLDLKSYYHLIDPSFITLPGFLEAIDINKRKEIQLTDADIDFTKQLVDLLVSWAKKAGEFASGIQEDEGGKQIKGGLVIGLTASRIISNVLLLRLDQLIKEKLTPIHYGRYVDDMFLVLGDPGTVDDTPSLMAYLKSRLGGNVLSQGKGKEKNIWQVNLGKNYQSASEIKFQADKQKLFILEGQAGLDLLDSIEKDITELSSERRLMPTPDQLENSPAARVLSAAGKAGEEADTLRRADGLTIRRLGWSLQLRHVETLANDLPNSEWKNEREEFYVFSHNHILRADRLFDHYPYLSRLLGFSARLCEWSQVEKIIHKAFKAYENLEKHCNSKMMINSVECVPNKFLFPKAKNSLYHLFIDSLARYYPAADVFNLKAPTRVVKRLDEILNKQYQADPNMILDHYFGSDEFYNKAPLLVISDLAAVPYRKAIKKQKNSSIKDFASKRKQLSVAKAFEEADLVELDSIVGFLKKSQQKRWNTQTNNKTTLEIVTPFLFPTRPYTPSEIAELVPACVGLGNISKDSQAPETLWAKYSQALRGVWVKPELLQKADLSARPGRPGKHMVSIGTQKRKSVLIGITNIETTHDSWEHSACNKPRLTLNRYKRISDLVNQVLKLTPRPDYLIFPELSIPLEWIESISNRLLSAGISMIAGTEYRHENNKILLSEAYLCLTDDRLGYPAQVCIWQPKLKPAVSEDKELIHKFGKSWKDNFKNWEEAKPVYNHDGFHFGVMICSEVLNSKARNQFQGEVDALMILSWNQDLDTFSTMIEACALDVHAYTVLVNNLTYGDSRVRAPGKKSFERDLARLRGGMNDFCVTVELDIEKLRAFQSREKRWPEDDDPFKPVPEDFKISSSRKHCPPK